MSNLPFNLLFQVSFTMQLKKSFPILQDYAQLFANQSYQVCLFSRLFFNIFAKTQLRKNSIIALLEKTQGWDSFYLMNK